MECKGEQCDFKKQVKEIAEGVKAFQKDTAKSIREFKDEVRGGISDVEKRQTRRVDRLEDAMKSDIQRVQMASDARLDKYATESNRQFLSIESSLGEIKGALGVKANANDVQKDVNDVTQTVHNTRTSIMRNVDNKVSAEQKARSRVLYMIITLLSGGLIFLLGAIARGNISF